MKFHRSIVALGRAIYAIRPEEGAKFDPVFAVEAIAYTGVHISGNVLTKALEFKRPDQIIRFNQKFADRLVGKVFHPEVGEIVCAYLNAIQHVRNFTDIFGLAADWLYANRNVDIRDYFAGEELFDRSWGCAVGFFEQGKFNPDYAMRLIGDRMGSSTLGLMTAVDVVYGSEKLSDTDFIAETDDLLDLCLAITQVSLWLCANPNAVRGITYVEPVDKDGDHHIWVTVGESPRCFNQIWNEKEAA